MEDDIETHPDLMNPDWRKHAERDAWLGAKTDLKQRRKLEKRLRRRKPRSRRWWGFLAFLAILAVTTAVVVTVGRVADHPAAAGPVNPTAVAPVARVDLAHAYANTPADTWKKGIDGITSPAPAAMGSFNVDAVADAYAKAKQAISAAHLDPAVLYRHDPAAFLALFAPEEQDDMRPIVTGAAKAPNGADASSYITRIADGYRLLDQGPRTFGTLTARVGVNPNELVVEAKYVVAYAFDNVHPEQLTGPSDIVSFFRTDEQYLIRPGKNFAVKARGLWLGEGDSLYSAINCSALDSGFLAPAYSSPPRPGFSGTDKNYPGIYDPSLPVPHDDTCAH